MTDKRTLSDFINAVGLSTWDDGERLVSIAKAQRALVALTAENEMLRADTFPLNNRAELKQLRSKRDALDERVALLEDECEKAKDMDAHIVWVGDGGFLARDSDTLDKLDTAQRVYREARKHRLAFDTEHGTGRVKR